MSTDLTRVQRLTHHGGMTLDETDCRVAEYIRTCRSWGRRIDWFAVECAYRRAVVAGSDGEERP